MDSPGFDSGNEQKAYLAIAEGIQRIQQHAQIIGVLYVHPVTQARFDDFDIKLLQFLDAVCGDAYLPRVTCITTFWTASNAKQQAGFTNQLTLLRQKWTSILGANHQIYQHGRAYDGAGEDLKTSLDWYDDNSRQDIASHAKAMIARNYSGSEKIIDSEPVLAIVHELEEGTHVNSTAAGRLLGLSPPMSATLQAGKTPEIATSGNNAATPAASDDQSTAGASQRKTSLPGQENLDGPGYVKGESPNLDNSARNTRPDRPNLLGDIFGGLLSFVGELLRVAAANQQQGSIPGLQLPSFQTAGYQTHHTNIGSFDHFSVVDAMKARGLNSDLGHRKIYAARHGIEGIPGSAAWNTQILNHLNKH
ncbi:hypothetical protein BKA63DRAFT_160565 [Paraphoma chrysanthemicola]|nr:hypothetical protein BKA63DRAFT_160565 [Paraphoma chrysanthemicola]